MINFFKKKLPAKSLAVMLMQYTILGNLTDDATAFALGPHSIETTDGSDVLPEDVERTNLNQLSSRDSLIIALETMYLRGFVAAFLLDRYVKKSRFAKPFFHRTMIIGEGLYAKEVSIIKI